MFGSTELILICLVVFVLFGAAAIPKFAKSLGQAKKAFKDGIDETDDETTDTKTTAKKKSK